MKKIKIVPEIPVRDLLYVDVSTVKPEEAAELFDKLRQEAIEKGVAIVTARQRKHDEKQSRS